MKKFIIAIIAIVLIMGCFINPVSLLPGNWEKATILGWRSDIGDGTTAIKVAVGNDSYWYYAFVDSDDLELDKVIEVKMTTNGRIVNDRL